MIGCCFSSCNGQSENPDQKANEYLNMDWAKNRLWDDGKAEVAIYEAERVVYGKPRQFEYVYVLVKEAFNEQYQVKTDDYERDDLYEVMKVNKFCRIETLAYPYHYLTSVFYKREAPGTVHKLTNTSQEWCGNTAKSFLEKKNHYLFEYMSYWDGEGNGSAKVNKGPWFEDQLSYTLRTLKFEEGLQFTVDLYPMQISSRATVPEPETATISITRADTTEIASLNPELISDPWKIRIDRQQGTDLAFWINGGGENTLLRMEASDGRKLRLKTVNRDAYWAHE